MMIHNHNVIKIGQGEFSIAYRSKDDPSVVFLLTPYDMHENANQYTKEIYSHIESEHIPYMSTCNDVYMRGQYYTCYETRFTDKLMAKHKEAWRIAKTLQKTWDSFRGEISIRLFRKDYDKLYEVAYNFIDKLREEESVPESVISALENIYTWACAFGSNFLFEFPARNLAVSEDGTLVLRDIVFFRSPKKW